MIGQNNLLAHLHTMISTGLYPRFSIIEGDKGSGRLTIAQHIAYELGASVAIISDLSVSNVREMINASYKASEKQCFIFVNADKMSISAKNSLLKITEEAPNNVYIIMTVEDRENMLSTIISRATVFIMDKYTAKERLAYIDDARIQATTEEKKLLLLLTDTPGEINELSCIGVIDFYEYVMKVYDNIAEVSGANSFKIASRLAIKESDEENYPLDLFFKAFMKVCSERMCESAKRNAYAIRITSTALSDLKIKGINRKMLVDSWILRIREGWIAWS